MIFRPEKYFEKNNSPVKKIEGKSEKDLPPKYLTGEAEQFEVERGEEQDQYNRLRKELALQQKQSNVDYHFTQFNPYKLSDKTLDLMHDYEMHRLKEEDLKNYMKSLDEKGDDYPFIAFLEHRLIQRNTEIVELKRKAENKFFEFSKRNPHIAAYSNKIYWDRLTRTDLKMLANENPEKISDDRFMDYENKYKKYLSMQLKEKAIKDVSEDPRYQYYLFVCNLNEKEPNINNLNMQI